MENLSIYSINLLQLIVLDKLTDLVDCYSDNTEDVLPLFDVLEILQNVKKELC